MVQQDGHAHAPGSAPTILLADASGGEGQGMEAACREAGYRVVTARDGRSALQHFFVDRPDVMIADGVLPLLDGFALVQRVREMSLAPIIMCSAVGSDEAKVRGLRLGADDYVVKPVSAAELLARVEAVLRRSSATQPDVRRVYREPGLTIDFERQAVLRHGEPIPMTPKEYRLLVYLVQRPGRLQTPGELLEGVWGSQHYAEESVKWHIANLRRKVEDDPAVPRRIVTVWGVGYRYEPLTGRAEQSTLVA